MQASSVSTPSPTAQRVKFDSAEFAWAQAVGQGRLNPTLFSSGYLLLRGIRRCMESFFNRHAKVGRVLDVGAQYCPYYPLFQDRCESYSSMDVVDTPLVDIVCSAEDMPLEEASYDLVLCTEVLEHCPKPQRIVDECYRVLKPGGTLIVTVPSIFPIHGYPADNWRFMPDGLKHLLRAFTQVEVLGILDFPQSLITVNCHYGHVLTGRMGAMGKWIDPIWNAGMNLGGRGLSLALRPLTRSNFSAFTTALWAEARK